MKNLSPRARLYLLTLPVLFVVDALWMCSGMGEFYSQQLANLVQLDPSGDMMPHFPSLFTVYALLAMGYSLYVYPAARKEKTVHGQFKHGIVYGLLISGVFNFSNHAYFHGAWPGALVAVDVCWGIAAAGLVTISVLYIAKRFKIA